VLRAFTVFAALLAAGAAHDESTGRNDHQVGAAGTVIGRANSNAHDKQRMASLAKQFAAQAKRLRPAKAEK